MAASRSQTRVRRPRSQAKTANTSTWGKKRARTAPTSRTPALASSSNETRDWANLGGDGPTGLIAEHVLANDVADYVRFRAVCRSWRRCSPDPLDAGLDSRFLPRHWIMLDKAHAASRPYRFLNISTGECIRTDLPELAEHTFLALSHEGKLLLLHEPTLVIRLLNPLTRQVTDLPPVTTLLTEEDQRAWRSGCQLEDIIWAYGVGLADTSTVAVCFFCPTVLTVARPGDEHWTVVDDRLMNATLSCAGRFYCAIDSNVMVLDTSSPDKQLPRLRLVATERNKPFVFDVLDYRKSPSLHLVDNCGELMLVHRTQVLDIHAHGAVKYKREYQVFRVDLDAGALAPAKDLRGQAVFMSSGRTVTISPGVFSSVTADTLYLGFDCNEKTRMNRTDGYNVADGSSEPSYHDSCHGMLVMQPWSLVDCLSYCIQGVGEQCMSHECTSFCLPAPSPLKKVEGWWLVFPEYA
ncbi:unnamed protein product [Urochloa humidicola]